MCDDEKKMLDVGPDPVAVVMAVEEKFNITIPDEDAEKLLNMGQLYDYIFARVVRGQAQVCFTSAAFYRLRRALGGVCGMPRDRVRPQARLEDLIPLDNRRQHWQELQDRLGGLHLPCLRRPSWLVGRIGAASFIPLVLLELCTILPSLMLRDTPAGGFLLFLGLLGVPVVGIPGMFLVCRALCRRTEHCAVHFPPPCVTVRDLVYALVSKHPAGRMVSDTERANDKEIWGILCAIVGGEFDRPPNSFTRKSTFV